MVTLITLVILCVVEYIYYVIKSNEIKELLGYAKTVTDISDINKNGMYNGSVEIVVKVLSIFKSILIIIPLSILMLINLVISIIIGTFVGLII